MKIEEQTEFAQLLTSALGFYGKDTTEFTLDVWWASCQPFDLEQVRQALTRHATDPDHGRFAPKPADIVRLLGGTATDRAMLAWGKVLEAMGSVGAYQDVVFDDPVIHAVVEDLGGWPKVCRGETKELSYLQHRFTESYRAYANKGQFPFQRVLIGARDSDGNYAMRGLPPPSPVVVGDPELAARVYRIGQAGGKTGVRAMSIDRLLALGNESRPQLT